MISFLAFFLVPSPHDLSSLLFDLSSSRCRLPLLFSLSSFLSQKSISSHGDYRSDNSKVLNKQFFLFFLQLCEQQEKKITLIELLITQISGVNPLNVEQCRHILDYLVKKCNIEVNDQVSLSLFWMNEQLAFLRRRWWSSQLKLFLWLPTIRWYSALVNWHNAYAK